MTYFAAIASTYESVEIALLRNSDMLQKKSLSKLVASRDFIVSFDAMLRAHAILLNDISFLAVNCGPGPYTTLRTVIASVNGLSFASSIPLIGINSIHALLDEYHTDTQTTTIALYNAFAKELFFGIKTEQREIITGCQDASTLLNHLSTQYRHKSIQFVGNGASLYQQDIANLFETPFYSIIPAQTSSIEQIARMGYAQWNAHPASATTMLLPHYGKAAI